MDILSKTNKSIPPLFFGDSLCSPEIHYVVQAGLKCRDSPCKAMYHRLELILILWNKHPQWGEGCPVHYRTLDSTSALGRLFWATWGIPGNYIVRPCFSFKNRKKKSRLIVTCESKHIYNLTSYLSSSWVGTHCSLVVVGPACETPGVQSPTT